MIGIPKLICIVQGSYPKPKPPKKELTATIGVIAYFSPVTPTGTNVFSQLNTQKVSLSGGTYEIKIKLPEGVSGLVRLKSVFVFANAQHILLNLSKDKGGIEDVVYKADEFFTGEKYKDELNELWKLQGNTIEYSTTGAKSKGSWDLTYNMDDYDTERTTLKYEFVGDLSLLNL